MTEKQATPPKLVKFKLAHPHTHAGVDKQPGETITLRADQAERLMKETPPRGEVVG